MALLLIASCTYAPRNVRTLASPTEVATLDRRAPYLKAHLQDGTVYVLSDWKVDESTGTVQGNGERQGPDRIAIETGSFTLRIDSVALFEANVVPKSESLRDVTLIAGVSLAITAACLMNPKACFGSCPTFYTGSGEDAPTPCATCWAASRCWCPTRRAAGRPQGTYTRRAPWPAT